MVRNEIHCWKGIVAHSQQISVNMTNFGNAYGEVCGRRQGTVQADAPYNFLKFVCA